MSMPTTNGHGGIVNHLLVVVLELIKLQNLKGNSTPDGVEISLPSSEWVARPQEKNA
jgi:hypothetical protein